MATMKDWFCKKNLNPGCAKGSGVDEVKVLTCQFHTTLRAYITKIEERALDPVPKALERIRDITKGENKDLSWQDAYEIEQQLVQLYDEPTLHVELERRLLDAERLLPATVADWYRERAEVLQDPSGLAALLSSLIDDLQWQYTRNEARRTYTKEITGRTQKVYIGTFLLFVSIFLLPQGLLFPWLLPFVGLAGAFGAAFSMMTGLRKRLADSTFDDLKLNRYWWLILTRVSVGIGAGIVLFFFVRSGLLGKEVAQLLGSGAFSDLATGNGFDVLSGDFAKLFISCFIAGFSERLVPNLLSRTQERLGEPVVEPPQIHKVPPVRPVPPMGRNQDRSEESAGGQSKTTDVTRNQGQDHATGNVKQADAKDGSQSP